MELLIALFIGIVIGGGLTIAVTNVKEGVR